MPEEKVNKLYSRWGGIPRYVLELTEPHHKAQQRSLDKAIQTADLQGILRYIGDAPGDASYHKIIHMIPEREKGYSRVYMQLASPYVAQAVVGMFCILKMVFCNLIVDLFRINLIFSSFSSFFPFFLSFFLLFVCFDNAQPCR
jgi:hypothetical protein